MYWGACNASANIDGDEQGLQFPLTVFVEHGLERVHFMELSVMIAQS